MIILRIYIYVYIYIYIYLLYATFYIITRGVRAFYPTKHLNLVSLYSATAFSKHSTCIYIEMKKRERRAIFFIFGVSNPIHSIPSIYITYIPRNQARSIHPSIRLPASSSTYDRYTDTDIDTWKQHSTAQRSTAPQTPCTLEPPPSSRKRKCRVPSLAMQRTIARNARNIRTQRTPTN